MLNQLCKKYTKYGTERQLVLPLDTEVLIPANEPVRLLDQVLEELDYTQLYLTYSDKGRNPSAEPVSLFKVLVYAYSQNIYSSRKIESACTYDVRYRYLLRSDRVPDHNTINRFRKNHLKPEILEDLFRQFTTKLMGLGEISLSEVFIDGTKIEANANKYSFVWRGSIEKNYEKLKVKAAAYLKDELGVEITVENVNAKSLKKEFDRIRKRASREKIVFTHGKGSRKSELQRQYETLEDWHTRACRYEEALQIMGEERNSYSKTDHDATFMHMKDDYMRNNQLKPGYNVQAATNSEYILGIYVSADRTDQHTLIPFLENLEKMYGQTPGKVIADAGYESEENYHYLKTKEIVPYIKPSNHEYSKTKRFQREMEFRLAMEYDAEEDSYTCKNGRKLTYKNTRKKEGKTGYIQETKIYECSDCCGCPYLGKCYKGKYSKRIQISPQFDEYRKESAQNITSEEGVLLRINRSIQSEGVFGITKQDMGFTRFLTRGKEMVEKEYLLLAFGFNINKLHNRIQNERIGKPLFIPEKMQKSA